MSSAITVYEVNPISEISDSTSTSHHPASKRQRFNNGGSSSKFKGVMRQKNGQWGAQLYTNHTRIWLGTFKSETDAAMAYDSAAIMFRAGESHRNFARTETTLVEPKFQNHHGAEAVLRMIRDGSYQSKLMDFIKACSTSEIEINLNPVGRFDDAGLTYEQLFQKELTPSDVGKLNRLVIPKKYAVMYFPQVHGGEKENAEGEGSRNSNDAELAFYDKFMRLWKFRYCYWSSSQSFVFTRGWNRFLKEKQLEANDVISFYVCECRKENEIRRFCMIDVKKVVNEGAIVLATNTQVGMEADLHYDAINGDKYSIEACREDEGRTQEVNAKGFKLFGVQIN